MSNAKLIGGFLVGAIVGGVIAASVANKPSAGPESPTASAPAAVSLESNEQKASYVIGANIGGQLSGQGVDFDMPALKAGLEDALTGAEPRLSEEESHATIQALIADQQAKAAERQAEQEAERAALSEKNKAEGEAFLAANKDKEGVVTTDSGLQYKVIEPGEGKIAGDGGVATIHYRGSFVDGTEFDSSYGGDPVQVEIDRVIPGWSEALKRMPAGSKWQVVVPPDLAYGDQGAGPFIAPGSTLVFEIELVEVS